MHKLAKLIKKPIKAVGLNFVRRRRLEDDPLYGDISPADKAIISSVMPYTMTSVERLYALIEAVRYVSELGLPGDIVECGVWRGGSMLAAAKTLAQQRSFYRNLYLFDTFEGMTQPTEFDVSWDNRLALRGEGTTRLSQGWCYAPEQDVRMTMGLSAYPMGKIHLIKGKVEETLPHRAPENISLLRLDTDWYESTKHELVCLYPRLSRGGVLIIDDYGEWLGARRAVDEYFKENNVKVLLNRIDLPGRACVKP